MKIPVRQIRKVHYFTSHVVLLYGVLEMWNTQRQSNLSAQVYQSLCPSTSKFPQCWCFNKTQPFHKSFILFLVFFTVHSCNNFFMQKCLWTVRLYLSRASVMGDENMRRIFLPPGSIFHTKNTVGHLGAKVVGSNLAQWQEKSVWLTAYT